MKSEIFSPCRLTSGEKHFSVQECDARKASSVFIKPGK